MDIRVCCPSYKRPYVETKEYLPFIKVYVSPLEYEKYKKNNPEITIVECDEGIQGNVCRARNHILEREFNTGADVVLIIDDDMKGVYYWEGTGEFKVKSKDFLYFVEKFSVLADDWGARLWGVNINSDKQGYREYSPFSTLSYIGAPFQCFLKGNECRYDERLSLKEDYDMTLQQINRYRIALRVNKYFYRVKQSKQEGGCASYRNYKEEKRQLELLQQKWGQSIVKEDKNNRSHNLKKKRRN